MLCVKFRGVKPIRSDILPNLKQIISSVFRSSVTYQAHARIAKPMGSEANGCRK
jgi:hypothetical protein